MSLDRIDSNTSDALKRTRRTTDALIQGFEDLERAAQLTDDCQRIAAAMPDAQRLSGDAMVCIDAMREAKRALLRAQRLTVHAEALVMTLHANIDRD